MHGAAPDAAGPPPGDAPAADSPPDAPPGPTSLEIDSAGAPITSWHFVDTAPGQHASSTFVVRNVGSAPAAPLAVMSTSSDVTVDPATTCGGVILAPGDYCFVSLSYRPSSAGDLAASLHVSDGMSEVDLALSGHAMTPSPGLVADVSMLDFGIVETGVRATATVLLENIGASDITLDALTTSDGFSVFDNNCPTPLTPGGACTVTLSFMPAVANAAVAGTFTATSDVNDVVVSLTALPLRRITVGPVGGGTGTVTSAPSGISCTPDFCTGLFLGAVTLTAEPSPDSLFGSWYGGAGAPCGLAPQCVVPVGGSVGVELRFELASTAKTVSVTFAGGGIGRVNLEVNATGESVVCNQPCTIYYAPGTDVLIAATTPDAFTSWTGACVTTDPHCNLGTVVNDRAATATFGLDDREVRSILPPVRTDVIRYTSDGDLVVAGPGSVARLAPTGEVRWSRALGATTGSALGVAATPDGDVVQLQASTNPVTLELTRLTGTGDVRWTRTFPSAVDCGSTSGDALLVAPNGDVAVISDVAGVATLAVFDADNNPRWSLPNLVTCTATVGADATYHLLSSPEFSEIAILRYDLDGNQLSDQGTTSDELVQRYAFAATAGGNLAEYAGDSQTVTLSLIAPDGTPLFSHASSTIGFEPNITVAFDSDGNVIAERDANTYLTLPGVHLEQWTTAGTLLWSVDKVGYDQIPYDASDLFWITTMATDGAKHVSVGGQFNGVPWIETFEMP